MQQNGAPNSICHYFEQNAGKPCIELILRASQHVHGECLQVIPSQLFHL